MTPACPTPPVVWWLLGALVGIVGWLAVIVLASIHGRNQEWPKDRDA